MISEKDEGSNRIKVILLPYQTSLDYIYVRRIFHDSWTDSSWSKREYAAKSDLKTVTKTGITDDKGNVNTGLNSSYATVIYASPTSSTLDYKMSVHVNKRGEYWAKVLSSWLDNAPSIKNTQIEYMVRYLDYSGS